MSSKENKEKRKALKGVSSQELKSDVHMSDTLDRVAALMKKEEK